MSQYKAFMVAISIFGGGAYIVQRNGMFVVGVGSSVQLDNVKARGKTRRSALLNALNKKHGTAFK